MLAGCGASALDRARSTVITLGRVLTEVDAQFAPAYEQARVRARAESNTLEERDRRLAEWESARSALSAAFRLVQIAALSLELAEDELAGDWPSVLAKSIDAIRKLCDALKAVGLDVPRALTDGE